MKPSLRRKRRKKRKKKKEVKRKKDFLVINIVLHRCWNWCFLVLFFFSFFSFFFSSLLSGEVQWEKVLRKIAFPFYKLYFICFWFPALQLHFCTCVKIKYVHRVYVYCWFDLISAVPVLLSGKLCNSLELTDFVVAKIKTHKCQHRTFSSEEGKTMYTFVLQD